jgi:hypothetical protein
VCRLASKDVRPRTRYLKSRLEPVTSVTGRDGLAARGKKNPTESRRAASELRPISLIVATTRPDFHRSLPHSAGRWLPTRNGGKAGWRTRRFDRVHVPIGSSSRVEPLRAGIRRSGRLVSRASRCAGPRAGGAKDGLRQPKGIALLVARTPKPAGGPGVRGLPGEPRHRSACYGSLACGVHRILAGGLVGMG